MGETLFTIGDVAVSAGAVLVGGVMLALVILTALSVIVVRAGRERRTEIAAEEDRSDELQDRVEGLARIQAETVGRLQVMTDTLSGRQAELARVVDDRLSAVTHRLDQSMAKTTQQTMERLRHLHERLAVIDSAQKNLGELASQVTSLREILANKQMRGAFGQGRMEAIVRDGLPKGSFEFQFTLSNRTRPDCAVFLPNDDRPLIIDAKFPLEAVSALRDARTEDAKTKAAQRVRQDVSKHVSDIATRYLIPGETHELALMFVPSESVYAELYDGFDDIIQKAYRAQVIIVSPSLLMLAIQVVQQIGRDARMREAAGEIRTEVGLLMGDLGRLHERVLKLQQHFGQANEDVAQVLVSADKLVKRGGRIEALEFGGNDNPGTLPLPLVRKMDAAE